MSFAYNLSAPEFSSPQLNAPRPCSHASNCYYNGPNGCAFVHPGEEGTGMKIFPARTFKDATGKETWQKATVRLIGGAGFYERRRLKMSWPQWCALPKNAHLQKPVKLTEQLAPTVAPLFATKFIAKPAEPVQVNFSELTPAQQWLAMFQKGYAADTPEILAARTAFMTSFSPEATALNEKAIQEVKRQQMGEALYALITPFLEEHKEGMKEAGVWHDKITAGKVTAILLESLPHEDLSILLTDRVELEDRLADCCVLIKDSA